MLPHIPIYTPDCTDFSTNGEGLLFPTSCVVNWKKNGRYDLTLIHPISDDLRWAQLKEGCIIKAMVPVPAAPDAVAEGTSITRRIYMVATPHGGRLRFRQKPSTSARTLSMHKPGTEVVKLSESGDWFEVKLVKGGATGWMYSDYLTFVREAPETVGQPGVIRPTLSREQLFRIQTVEPDTENVEVTAQATALFFDLTDNLVDDDYQPEAAPAAEVARHVMDSALNPHEFTLHVDSGLTSPITGDYGYGGVKSALLDVANQSGGWLMADNFDLWLVQDNPPDRGVTVRRGKNLVGVRAPSSALDVVTRIVPVGTDKDGNPLKLPEKYVDSAHIGDYPVVHARKIEYDVKVGEGFKDSEAAFAELRRLAKAEFDGGCDLPSYGLNVNFVVLEENSDFESLQAIPMGGTATAIDELIGLRASIRMTECEWDVLTQQYNSMALGDVLSVEQTTYGYSLADGSVSGGKLIPGTVSGTALRSASIQYAKIAQAAIEQLSANAITALRAHINELVAGSVTTDQLYADLAVIAAAQITAANIAKANIDWAEIATLNAQIAEIAEATIVKGEIKWAEIETLNAQIASVAQAKIDNAEITSAQITDLETTVANIFSAKIGSADIDFAQIKDLVTQQAIITEGVGGQLYIARLAVTEANMVSLTVGELIVKGSDGRFYSFSVDENGNVTTELKEISNDDVADASIHGTQKLIEGSITAQVLNVEDIFADSAIIRQMIAANIDVATLFAREATIDQLNALDIRGNEYLRLLVGEKNTVYRQEEQPEGAAVNDLWIQPSTGYTWQYTAAEPLPELYLDGDGNLFYAYADGAEGYEYVIDDDGNLLYSGEGGQTVSSDGELVNVLWVRVKDGDLSAAELKLTDEGIMGVVTGTQAWQDVQSAAEVTESQIAALESQFTQRMDGFELSVSETVGRDELRTYIRYEDGAVELGSSASRYTAQISDKGFVVLQDGESMTSMVQNTVSAPVIEARRQFQLGGFALRIGASGHLFIT